MINLINKMAAIVNETEVNIPKTPLTSTRVEEALKIFFGIAAAVAVLIITISALKIVLSRGEPQAVAKARDAIIYAAAGLVICLTAFIIVSFVVNRV